MTGRKTHESCDLARASKYLALCQPDPERYAEYLASGERLMTDGGGAMVLRFPGNSEPMSARIQRRRSLLFGRDYFLAWIPSEPYDAHNGQHTDAIAEIRWPGGEDARPPLILVPLRYRANRSLRFVSILEHETVHISQILGSHPLPTSEHRPTAGQLVTSHFAHTRLEFLADFIQGVRWPHTVRSQLRAWSTPLRLEQWSLLRGYTQALESLFSEIARRQRVTSASVLRGFLDSVPSEANERLGDLCLSEQTLGWFKARWREDVERALLLTIERRTPEDDVRLLRPIHEWTKPPARKARRGGAGIGKTERGRAAQRPPARSARCGGPGPMSPQPDRWRGVDPERDHRLR
jgi:hypothetical protein